MPLKPSAEWRKHLRQLLDLHSLLRKVLKLCIVDLGCEAQRLVRAPGVRPPLCLLPLLPVGFLTLSEFDLLCVCIFRCVFLPSVLENLSRTPLSGRGQGREVLDHQE